MSAEDLFDSLAAGYDEHFAVPHRRAYDDLAWEFATALLPEDRPARVLDIGCGVGRWAQRLLAAGHTVTGIEPAPAMAAAARARLGDQPGWRLLEARVESIADPGAPFDLILAMGSLQYCDDPAAVITRAASWLRPGAALVVLTDSLLALVLELLRAGDTEQALERARTRRGCWRHGDLHAELHLLDRAALTTAFTDAGLADVRAYGLLVGASIWGRAELARRLTNDAAHLDHERALAHLEPLADLGKQLFVSGRRAG